MIVHIYVYPADSTWVCLHQLPHELVSNVLDYYSAKQQGFSAPS